MEHNLKSIANGLYTCIRGVNLLSERYSAICTYTLYAHLGDVTSSLFHLWNGENIKKGSCSKCDSAGRERWLDIYIGVRAYI
jgi:hypothetical protein